MALKILVERLRDLLLLIVTLLAKSTDTRVIAEGLVLEHRVVRDKILLVSSLWYSTALTIAWLKMTKWELVVVRVHRQVVTRLLPLYLQAACMHLISLSFIAAWLLVWGGELASTLGPLLWLCFLDKLLACARWTFNFLLISLDLLMIFFSLH